MQMRRGEFIEVLAARDGGDALVATRRGSVVHVQRRGYRRLHPGELSQRRRPLRSGADRAETGLFSRVSFRRDLTSSKVEGQRAARGKERERERGRVISRVRT